MKMMIIDVNNDVIESADHMTVKLAIVSDNYDILTTDVTFYDCTIHSSYVYDILYQLSEPFNQSINQSITGISHQLVITSYENMQ